jgi:hypothetical protein
MTDLVSCKGCRAILGAVSPPGPPIIETLVVSIDNKVVGEMDVKDYQPGKIICGGCGLKQEIPEYDEAH